MSRTACPMLCQLTRAAVSLLAVAVASIAQAAAPEENSVSRLIDERIDARLKKEGVLPAPRAGEASLVRRLYLDLLGRPPRAGETERFLSDATPDKLDRLIDELLAHREMPVYWRRVIDRWLNGQGDRQSRRPGYDEFLAWLQESLAANRPWDRMARAMLVPDAEAGDQQRAAYMLVSRLQGEKSEQLDNIATSVASSLFGVQLQCAKCHDHPTVDVWRQDHYYGLASVFTGLEAKNENGRLSLQQKTPTDVKFVTRGKEERTAAPVFLDDQLLVPDARKSNDAERKDGPVGDIINRRAALADHALRPESPYFKRSLVNHVWKQLLGRGLVEPVDQIHDANPASHPQLLVALADDFADHGFDLRRLLSGILHSEAYLRDSRYPGADRPPDELYAVAMLKPLDGEQIAWSLVVATGGVDPLFAQLAKDPKRVSSTSELDPALRIRWEREQDFDQILGKFRSAGESFQANASQALFLSFNPFVKKLLEPRPGNLVQTLASEADDRKAIDLAVLTVLSRRPTDDEISELESFLKSAADRKQACADIVWALLTSAEFRFNH